MNIVEIRLANIMCFEEKVIRVGQITTVTGANGVGKSTIAESVKNVIGGGNDVTLLRAGAEEGEIALLLDDGMEIIKRITSKGSTVTVKHPQYGKISKPQSVIESLAQIAAVNPVSFLTMPEKKRAEYLLDVCPIEVTQEEVVSLLADAGGALLDGEGLALLESARRSVYDERTRTNGALKEKRSTIATLASSLPQDRSELERDMETEIAAKEAERAAIVEEAEVRIQNLTDVRHLETVRATADLNERMDHLRTVHKGVIDRIEEQIRELEAQRSEEIAHFASVLGEAEIKAAGERQDREKEFLEARQAIRDEALPKIGAIDNELATLTEARRHADRYRQTAKQVDEYSAAASALEKKADQLTETIERLDDLKRAKLSQLPIPGIEIRDGLIYRDDVPFDRLNTAQRVGIAFDLAVLRAGKMPFVFVDGAECLDQESQAELERRATEAGVQLMTFAVGTGPLEIVTKEMEVAA